MIISRCIDRDTGATLLRALKDHHQVEAVTTVAELMLEDTRALKALTETDALVAVPSSYPNKVKRGFDLPALIAGHLAKRTGKPILHDTLYRRSWRSQRRIEGRTTREQHQLGFTVKGHNLPKTVALIDDLAVTTSTLNQAATTLREAGAQRVWSWTFGRRAYTKTTEALTKE